MDNGLYPQVDLKQIVDSAGEELGKIENSKIAILGGTGFVGSWLLSALQQANTRHSLNNEFHIFTRNVTAAKFKLDFLNCGNQIYHLMDFGNRQEPTQIEFDFFVNGATPTVPTTGSADGLLVYASTINSTNFIIESAKRSSNRTSVLNLSSGAVYDDRDSLKNGSQKEILMGGKSYADAKREAETLLHESETRGELEFSSPRLFAFMGPGIAIDQQFAIGNFVRNGLLGEKVKITGSPDTRRSYLYPIDLVSSLIPLLVNPSSAELDIGSVEDISMLELARLVAEITNSPGVEIVPNNAVASIYIPVDQEGKRILPVEPLIGLREGINRWLNFLQS